MQQLAQKLKLLRVGDLAVRRNPLYYGAARERLDELEHANLEERRAWTGRQLAEVLWAARLTAYGKRVRGARELASWPLLEKSAVRTEPGAFGSGGLLASRASTGGTSGAPLPLVRSLRSVVFEQACLDRMMASMGVAPAQARIAVLRGDNIKDPSDFSPPYWKHVAGGRRMVMSSNHLNTATAPRYAEALEAFKPDLLWAYPTALESLCVHLARAHRKLAVGRVLTSSEVLHPQVWRLATKTLGCRLVDYYGQAERVAFAYATEPGAYRFLPGYAHVELLPAGEDGKEVLYEIVGTSLWNRSMPLVRYRTGDLIRVPPQTETQLEEIALGLKTFPGVLGRDSDILISPDGVRLTGIDHFQRDIANLVRIQVIQETARDVRILVLATGAFGEHDAAQLLANARRKLPASMRVRLEPVAALERTSLGKVPFVIHRPAVKALLRAGAA
jgi:phenylacetate-CoA ligase